MKAFSITYALLFSVILNSFCQETPASWQGTINTADSLMANKKYEQAAILYDSIGKKLFSHKDKKAYFIQSTKAGICLTKARKYKQAQSYLLELEKNHKKEINKNDEQLGLIYHKIGVAYSNYQDKVNAVKYYQKAVEIRKSLSPINLKDLTASLKNTASSYKHLGQFDKAIDIYKQLLLLSKKDNNPSQITYVYINMGICYRRKGDFDQTLSFYRKAEQIILKEKGPNHTKLGELYNSIGILYYDYKKYKNAHDSYQKALNIYNNAEKKDKRLIALAYNNIGLAYNRMNNFEEAINYIFRALDTYKQIEYPNAGQIIDFQKNIGSLYLGVGKYTKARKFLSEALAASQENWGENHIENSSILFSLGELNLEEKKYQEALQYFQKTIQSHLTISLKDNIHALPDFEKHGVVGRKKRLLETLEFKANNYQALAKSDSDRPDSIYKQYALETYICADQLIDLMRKEHTAKGSKLFWTATTLPIYEQAIETALQLYDQTKEPKYLDQAFTFSEKSKGILLLESLQDNKAKQFAGIPPQLLEKEADLSQKLTDAQQNLFSEQQFGEEADSSQLKKYASQEFEYAQAKLAIVKELETNHPEYYKMKYNTRTASLKETQQQLGPNKAILDYFVGNEQVFLFKITATEVSYHQLGKSDSLANQIEAFRNSIFNYFMTEGSTKEDYQQASQQYVQLGKLLYDYLIPDEVAADLPEQLVIIPDGVLGYLPFDALLTTIPEQVDKFKTHPYLMRDHQIAYAYSATLLQEFSRRSQNNGRGLLAFAPTFGEKTDPSNAVRQIASNTRGLLGPLAHNEEEVQAIQQLIGGKYLLGSEATENRFRALAADYQILHFATHGKANDENSDYSYLAFTEQRDSLENEFLYVNDLYGMRLSADLAVLSACETGIGKLQRGEGIASLARGFSYAGVPSIITTLWSVNDAKTSLIIQSFYENLVAGKSKDKALRQAKLEYLETSDHYHSHPFFWAAPIAIGDMRVIEIGGANWWWMGGCFLLLVGVGWWKFRS